MRHLGQSVPTRGKPEVNVQWRMAQTAHGQPQILDLSLTTENSTRRFLSNSHRLGSSRWIRSVCEEPTHPSVHPGDCFKKATSLCYRARIIGRISYLRHHCSRRRCRRRAVRGWWLRSARGQFNPCDRPSCEQCCRCNLPIDGMEQMRHNWTLAD
jgi:hypothetical protein